MNEKILVYYSPRNALLATTFADSVRSELPEARIYRSELPSNGACWDSIRRSQPDVVSLVCDPELRSRLPSLVGELRAKHPMLPLVLVRDSRSRDVTEPTTISSLTHVLFHPAPDGHLREFLVQLLRENQISRPPAPDRKITTVGSQVLGGSQKFLDAMARVRNAAKTDATVLLTGESGTGKTFVAETIHNLSSRSAASFVWVDCGSLTGDLIANELFGHEAGSFTGADSKYLGRVAAAERGTLLIDDIDSLTPAHQSMLLGLLDRHEYYPIGSAQPRKADVRLITATNADLAAFVQAGKFRSDLFWRIKGISIHLPPLRERVDDIPQLAQHFLELHAKKEGLPKQELRNAVLRALMGYNWPGNLRELDHVMQQAVIFAQGEEIRVQHLDLPEIPDGSAIGLYKEAREKCLAEFNRTYLGNLLRFTGGNKSRVARMAGMDLTNLRRLTKKYKPDI